MRWPIKEKKNEDYLYTGFALFPTTVQNYRVWLEKYYYFKVVDFEVIRKHKFINYQDCLTALNEAVKNNEWLI